MSDPHTLRRLRKRSNGVEAIRSTHEYQTVLDLWYRGDLRTMPLEPDPTDMVVSKRAWEWNMQVWRQELRRIAASHPLR